MSPASVITFSHPMKRGQEDLFKAITHILIGHVPIGTFPVGHDLPHNDSVTPHVTCGGEFAILDGFWCSPSDGDLAALLGKTLVSSCSKSR